MMGYRISVKAREDLENIWRYTFENWSQEQADRYVNLIFDEIEYLATNPESGRDFGHVREHYRSSKVKSHVVFYKHTDVMQEIEIIRILHQRMDLENRLND
jgi:toxin ParE1/3/4